MNCNVKVAWLLSDQKIALAHKVSFTGIGGRNEPAQPPQEWEGTTFHPPEWSVNGMKGSTPKLWLGPVSCITVNMAYDYTFYIVKLNVTVQITFACEAFT